MAQPSGEFGQENLRVRAGELVSGQYLVTVAGPEGSGVRPCPPEQRPAPQRWTAEAPRPGGRAALGPGPSPAVGPLALGAGPGDLPLLDREADIAHLLGKLAEGRSIRLVGEPGSGRSSLLAAVAEGAGDLAPDGVVRLCGHRRSAADLLQDLFAATHRAPGFRPDPAQLTELLASVGAIVVIDEVAPDGEELEQLLATAPECAFLISGAPGSGSAPAPGSRLEGHLVAGLSKSACLALTARLAGRPLEEAERAWAVDLWFESEGLPLRFVQAAALLRQRDIEVDALLAAEEDQQSVFGRSEEPAHEYADPAVRESELRAALPLPSVAETAAPAVRLAAGLSEAAQAVLRLSLALGGECPTAPHLPALIAVDHGESALRELADCGLAEPIGGHHRLTAGVSAMLAERWPADGSTDGAARHFSWWVGHGSVTTDQIAAEAEVVIGALLADRAAERHEAVLWLARAAAPALALSLRWDAWREVLELGLGAARQSGEGVQEAWFYHELGAYWFCVGDTGRARACFEAAGALRTTLGEVRGVAATRLLLTLLEDEERAPLAIEAPAPAVRRPVIRVLAARSWRTASAPVGALRGWSRRSVVAASVGLLAIGVVGTAVGLSVGGPAGDGSVAPPSTSAPDGTPDGTPTTAATSGPASASATVPAPAPSSASPSVSASPSESPSASHSASRRPVRPSTSAPVTTAPPSPSAPAPTTAPPTSASAPPPPPPPPPPSTTAASPSSPSPSPSTSTPAAPAPAPVPAH